MQAHSLVMTWWSTEKAKAATIEMLATMERGQEPKTRIAYILSDAQTIALSSILHRGTAHANTHHERIIPYLLIYPLTYLIN